VAVRQGQAADALLEVFQRAFDAGFGGKDDNETRAGCCIEAGM